MLRVLGLIVLNLIGLAFDFGRGAQDAWAVLGEQAISIEADRNRLGGVKRQSLTSNLYSVHEIQSGGVTVREYVSSSGLVFGLAWNGRVHPELGALLGSYKAEYQDGLKASPRKKGQRAHAVRGARVVVEKWGHMRNLKGRAYDPALLPAGVKADEIK
jgi:hypothetical protein